MNLATQYAEAIFGSEPPAEKVHAVLKSRGHEKLLPQIVLEMEKIELTKKRSEQYKQITPNMQQNDRLLQLYKQLIS